MGQEASAPRKRPRILRPCREKVDWSEAIDGELETEKQAVGFCHYMIREYEGYWRCRKPFFRILGGTALLFAATTPVLIATGLPQWVKGLPAAIAAAIGGILAIAGWQEGIARSGHMAEALKCELLCFQTRVEPYNDEQRLETFVSKLVQLRMTEVEGWRTGFLALPGKPGEALPGKRGEALPGKPGEA